MRVEENAMKSGYSIHTTAEAQETAAPRTRVRQERAEDSMRVVQRPSSFPRHLLLEPSVQITLTVRSRHLSSAASGLIGALADCS